MSGFEIAGIVLGAFPLLISAAEHYKKGFKPLLNWKRFRAEFIGFIDTLDIEKQLYDQMLQRLLISAGVPPDEMSQFLSIPSYKGWQTYEPALKKRLGASYPAYMSTLSTMKVLMTDLQKLLHMKDGEIEWSRDGSNKWDYQMKRIQLSFSQRGPTNTTLLEKHIRKLRELLDSTEKLEKVKASWKNTAFANIFECIRQHATSLHSALKAGWNCECSLPHAAALQLQQRLTGDWKSQFQLSFDRPMSLQSEGALVVRRQVEISTRTTASASVTDSVSRSCAPLRRELLNNIRSNFEVPRNRSPRAQRTNVQESSTCTVTEIQPSKAPKRSAFAIGGIKRKRAVAFEVATEVVELVPVIPRATELVAKNSSLAITDLCSMLFDLRWDDKSRLGFLADPIEDRNYDIALAKQAFPSLGEPVSLKALLMNQAGHRLSRQERYIISGVLASSFLQLQCTPWLVDQMSKETIYFYRDESRIDIKHPYIKQSFSSVKDTPMPLYSPQSNAVPSQASAKVTSRFAARDSIFAFGILLLELCFGQPIESQELRRAYLGPDGQPYNGTDFLTARDWVDEVYQEEPALEQIIRNCLFCNFEEKADWSNKKFTQAVYDGVVEPLEKVLEDWSDE